MTRSRTHPPLPRHIDDTDVGNDDHVRDLLAGLPGLSGPTMLAWLMLDGDIPLPALSVMEDSPAAVSVHEAHEMVGRLAAIAEHFSDAPGLLVAWKRRGPGAPTDSDLAWVRAAPAACADRGVRLAGVWLIAGQSAPLRLDAAVGTRRA